MNGLMRNRKRHILGVTRGLVSAVQGDQRAGVKDQSRHGSRAGAEPTWWADLGQIRFPLTIRAMSARKRTQLPERAGLRGGTPAVM